MKQGTIKECPFCGNRAMLAEQDLLIDDDCKFYSIQCQTCFATVTGETEEEARMKWSRRIGWEVEK